MKAVPLFSGILVKEVPHDKIVKSGLEIVATDMKDTSNLGIRGLIKGEVVKVGPGAYTSAGSHVPTMCQVGDMILFNYQDGRPIRIEGAEYWITQETTVLAILHAKDGNSVEDRIKGLGQA